MEAEADQMNPMPNSDPQPMSAAQLRRLPQEMCDAILEAAAAKAEQEYLTNPDLTAFEAFGEADLLDSYPDSEGPQE